MRRGCQELLRGLRRQAKSGRDAVRPLRTLQSLGLLQLEYRGLRGNETEGTVPILGELHEGTNLHQRTGLGGCEEAN